MRYIKEISFFKKDKEKEVGDQIVSKILDIIKKEKIQINLTGGYQIDLDDKIYSFANYGGGDCRMSIYNHSDRNSNGTIFAKPISTYKFSKKLWKELEVLYSTKNISDDLEELSDINRTAKKYNL